MHSSFEIRQKNLEYIYKNEHKITLFLKYFFIDLQKNEISAIVLRIK